MKFNFFKNSYYFFFLIIISYITIMFLPRKIFPVKFFGDDYAVHFISTLFLSYYFIKLKINLTFYYRIIILILFVVLKEILQELFTTRSFEISDIFFDILAITILLILYSLFNKKKK